MDVNQTAKWVFADAVRKEKIPSSNNLGPFWPGLVGSAAGCLLDAAERGVLFWDVMRQRGNQYREHLSETVPHVLDYEAELVLDGRTLARPVNYCLARIIPPAGVEIDLRRRPFVVVDPRAGHGPGIGGFKADSEIGVAMRAGHPCYFVGFLPEPMPGQTIDDVCRAEAVFLEKVISRHPEADGKPCVIGNCQAGWAVMMLAAIRPELFGPIIVAGSPLAYWAGVKGQNPMRYLGGLIGGTWSAALASDLGCGTFDGAWLVQNFERLNPSNTIWSKQYNLYAKIDTEAPRYLEFERWWGGHVYLNAAEIQFIADELFVGNKLAAGRVRASDDVAIDLRNVRSPIVVFCSKADNITPPQQALGWILDLYRDVNEIRTHGQTIVYTIHESAGHLGIFVSGGVARKEHDQFASNIDLIDMLPPGLYEGVLEAKSDETANPDLASGDWIMRFEARTLDDIRALGGNDPVDEQRFAAAARISDINLAFYRAFMQPAIRAVSSMTGAQWMRHLHPLRLQYELFTDANPLMAAVRPMAQAIRVNRHAAEPANPFLAMQDGISRLIVAGLDGFRDARDRYGEWLFLAIYGSPVLQAAVGIDPATVASQRKAARSTLHLDLLQARIAELKAHIPLGGSREAAIRSLIYVAAPRAAIDVRGFEAIRRLRSRETGERRPSLAEFKSAVREQFFMLLLDPEAALRAIPEMLPRQQEARRKIWDAIREVLTARGPIVDEVAERLDELRDLFGLDSPENHPTFEARPAA